MIVGEQLRIIVDGVEISSDDRYRVSASCHRIAQEHHHAILILFSKQLFISGFSLVRSLFESFIRAEWLRLCATEEEIQFFIDGGRPPPLGQLLERLKPEFGSVFYSEVHKKYYGAMSDYTHTGGRSVQRSITYDKIETNIQDGELREVIKFAEFITIHSVYIVSSMSANFEGIPDSRIIELWKSNIEFPTGGIPGTGNSGEAISNFQS